MPQVIALFSFIFQEAYLNQLQESFPKYEKEVSTWTKDIKRIGIFRHLAIKANEGKGALQTAAVRGYAAVDDAMRNDLRKKINYTSKETILEFKLRKDAHYKS